MKTMTAEDEQTGRKMDAARKVMDEYDQALSALSGNASSRNLEDAMIVARERMDKYRNVYSALSK